METEEISNELKDHEERLKKIEELLFKQDRNVAPVSAPSKKISINEFVVEKKPADDLQRTTLFAYFLEKHQGQERFNSDDMKECFRNARATMPQNISDKINQCIKKGWISEDTVLKDGKKSFYLTNEGVIAVDNNFQKEKKINDL